MHNLIKHKLVLGLSRQRSRPLAAEGKVIRLEQRINGYSKRVIQQLADHPRQQRTGQLQTRVRVALYQIHLERVIYHEVKPIDLKRMDPSVRDHLPVDSLEGVSDQGAHLGQDVSVETDVTAWEGQV